MLRLIQKYINPIRLTVWSPNTLWRSNSIRVLQMVLDRMYSVYFTVQKQSRCDDTVTAGTDGAMADARLYCTWLLTGTRLASYSSDILLWICIALQRHKKRKFETNILRKGIARPQSKLPHPWVCERFIYSQDRCAFSVAGKYVDRFWEYINRSQTRECGNRDWGRAIPFRCSVVNRKHQQGFSQCWRCEMVEPIQPLLALLHHS